MLSSIVAAFIVPGVIYFIQKELLTSAPINPYDALALMSLCLIAATIGNPFIDFVQAEARWWMAERTKQRDALKKFTDEAKETLQQLENKMKELEQQGTQSTDQGG
jgi:hypothetical protein